MSFIPALKDFAKKSARLHSLYKLARDAATVPHSKWLSPRQLFDVFRVLPNTMVPMPRLFDAYDAIETINREKIPGDIVECGVWNGGCAGLMGLADRTGRSLHLFDSFEGLPQPTKEDSDLVTKHGAKELKIREGHEIVAMNACVGVKANEVEKFIRNIGLRNYVFHVGWFQQTVPAAGIESIAILRLDGDWYESTKVCLEGLYDKVSPGGFIIIDDYGCFEGCKRAVDEFFLARSIAPKFIFSDSMCCYFRK